MPKLKLKEFKFAFFEVLEQFVVDHRSLIVTGVHFFCQRSLKCDKAIQFFMQVFLKFLMIKVFITLIM